MTLARLHIEGDLDGLGPDSIYCEAWLDFDGISMLLRDGESSLS